MHTFARLGQEAAACIRVALAGFPLLFQSSGAAAEAAAAAPRASLQQVQRIGLLPLTTTVRGEHDGALQTIERLLREQLQAAGFTTIGSDVYAGIRRQHVEAAGGIYDPRTGALDESQQRQIETDVLLSFIRGQKLDATARVEVRVQRAPFAYDLARWDGVTDRASGPPRSLSEDLRAGHFYDLEGTVPAASLIVTLSAADGTTLFSGAGGIELQAYASPRDFLSIRYLSVDQFLNDVPRLERAAATVGLLLSKLQGNTQRTALLTAQLQARSLPRQPVAPPQDAADFKKAGGRWLSSIKRVALTPITVREAPGGIEIKQRYEQLLTEQLRKLGWEVIPRERFVQLLDEARTHQGEAVFDVYTGERIEPVSVLVRRAGTRLATAGEPIDAIVYASIRRTDALQIGQEIRWGGVRYDARRIGLPEQKRSVIPALSFHVLLTDVDNETLYAHHGGIQLLERGVGNAREPIPEDQLLQDPRNDPRAVELALQPLFSEGT